jgi:putative CocE/NonD family hydrolase
MSEPDPARHRQFEVEVERDVGISAPDGTQLVADIYHPVRDGSSPTLMQRTVYGKQNVGYNAPWFAERGYRVVMQDCRGSGKSAGEASFFREGADGRATGDWITAQPWFDGRFGTFGHSYMTFTQLAFAATEPDYLGAMSVGLYASERRRAWFPGGSFALEFALYWSFLRTRGPIEAFLHPEKVQARLARGYLHLPLREADMAALEATVPWYQEWLAHADPTDRYFADLELPAVYEQFIAPHGIPVLFVDGWYDYALPYLLHDVERIRTSAGPKRLVVGPWMHSGVDGTIADGESLRWFDQHLGGAPTPPASPVRIFVMPDQGWRDLAAWPLPATAVTFYLGADGAFTESAPPGDESRTAWTYDPAEPTPSYGGANLDPLRAGPVANNALEARDDVCVFSTAVLAADVEVIGAIAARVFIESSTGFFDVFVRLCDVDADGNSTNITDAIHRRTAFDARDPDGVIAFDLELGPTAYRFHAGHRIRVQVSAGAHPLYARNLGSGEPIATGTTLVISQLAVRHDAAHPSALTFATTGA